jgi:hypothetical protein
MPFKTHEENAAFAARNGATNGANGSNDDEDFPWLKFESVDDLPAKEPEKIINGLLHVGEKLAITAGSKSFKTWGLLYLAYCISNGFPFLGFDTIKSKVMIFDLEISRYGIRRRLERIRGAIGQGTFENIVICSLRGKARKFCANFQKIQPLIRLEDIKVVIIDPVYKFLLGRNEADNALVADMLEGLTVFCEETNVAMIWTHHHSKGNQAAKDALDRSSGAGSWARDPDALLDLVDHKDSTKTERVFTVEITVREFPPVNNFVARLKFPLLVRDGQGLDPDDLKRPGGRPPKFKVQDLVNQLGDDELTTAEFKKRVIDETGMSPTTFYDLKREAEKAGLISQNKISGKWECIRPAYRA